jgi:hypothetical protein
MVNGHVPLVYYYYYYLYIFYVCYIAYPFKDALYSKHFIKKARSFLWLAMPFHNSLFLMLKTSNDMTLMKNFEVPIGCLTGLSLTELSTVFKVSFRTVFLDVYDS